MPKVEGDQLVGLADYLLDLDEYLREQLGMRPKTVPRSTIHYPPLAEVTAAIGCPLAECYQAVLPMAGCKVCRPSGGMLTLRVPSYRGEALAILQVVERASADSRSTQVEAVPNPGQVPAADFESDGAWPLMTGAQDIVQIASAFALDGFDVRSVVLVDRLFRVADEAEYADVSDAVLRYIASGNVRAALGASKIADLFVEQVRLFDKRSAASIDIRQNGVIITKNIEVDRIGDILIRAFDVP